MKLPKEVLSVIRGASAAALVATAAAGCTSQASAPVTVRTQAPVVASSGDNDNRPRETEEVQTDETPDWTYDEMAAACGRG